MKQCVRCEKQLSENYFYKNSSSPTGFYNICKSCKSSTCSKYAKNNSEKTQKDNAEWFQTNKELIRDERTAYQTKWRQIPANRIAHSLRKRIRHAIKCGSAIDNLDCSTEELKIKLESKFQSGMSWNNYGKWHIDHIKPLSKFDLTDPIQLKEACHYTNLQPLWAKDNLRKGAKYEQP